MEETKFIRLVQRVERLITRNPTLYYTNWVGEDKDGFWLKHIGFVPDPDSIRVRIHRFGSLVVLRCTYLKTDGDEFILYNNVGGKSLDELEWNYLQTVRKMGDFSSPEELEMWLDTIGGE